MLEQCGIGIQRGKKGQQCAKSFLIRQSTENSKGNLLKMIPRKQFSVSVLNVLQYVALN